MKPTRNMKPLMVVAVISIIVVLIWVSYSVGHLEPFVTSFTNPLWMSVLVTFVLVGINAYYSWQTRQEIAEMKKARKSEFMPHIKIALMFLGPLAVILRITNVGKGPAIDVKTMITFSPKNETRPWEQPLMSPDEIVRVTLPNMSLHKVCETAAQISIKGSYKDIFGQEFPIDEVIDTKEFIEKMTQLKPVLETDLPQLVRDIRDEVQKLTRAIEGLQQRMRSR